MVDVPSSGAASSNEYQVFVLRNDLGKATGTVRIVSTIPSLVLKVPYEYLFYTNYNQESGVYELFKIRGGLIPGEQ